MCLLTQRHHVYLSCRYALTGKEVMSILMQRLVKVDGKVRTDCTYPAGFMDVIEIDRTDEHFRLIYDTKGRFVTHRITKVWLRAGCTALCLWESRKASNQDSQQQQNQRQGQPSTASS